MAEQPSAPQNPSEPPLYCKFELKVADSKLTASQNPHSRRPGRQAATPSAMPPSPAAHAHLRFLSIILAADTQTHYRPTVVSRASPGNRRGISAPGGRGSHCRTADWFSPADNEARDGRRHKRCCCESRQFPGDAAGFDLPGLGASFEGDFGRNELSSAGRGQFLISILPAGDVRRASDDVARRQWLPGDLRGKIIAARRFYYCAGRFKFTPRPPRRNFSGAAYFIRNFISEFSARADFTLD